jgi:diaminopimelate epimerase
MSEMEIIFYKYQGTGNDFVILDNRDGIYSTLTEDQVRFLCDRKFGIGADGLMLLETLEGFDFKMKYYNADGKEGSMCGNGGRCLVQFAKDMGISRSHYHFLAVDGPHEAEFDSKGLVRLKMQDVNAIASDGADKVLDTGSPHYIRFMDDLNHLDVFTEGRKIRYNSQYSEKGINVNFVSRENGGIRVRTYERGVEDETLSCGTGVTASAIAASNDMGQQHVFINVEGGKLEVAFNRLDEQHCNDIWLIGPATFVYAGKITLAL